MTIIQRDYDSYEGLNPGDFEITIGPIPTTVGNLIIVCVDVHSNDATVGTVVDPGAPWSMMTFPGFDPGQNPTTEWNRDALYRRIFYRVATASTVTFVADVEGFGSSQTVATYLAFSGVNTAAPFIEDGLGSQSVTDSHEDSFVGIGEVSALGPEINASEAPNQLTSVATTDLVVAIAGNGANVGSDYGELVASLWTGPTAYPGITLIDSTIVTGGSLDIYAYTAAPPLQGTLPTGNWDTELDATGASGIASFWAMATMFVLSAAEEVEVAVGPVSFSSAFGQAAVDSLAFEFRIKFPGSDNVDMPPTSLSGELVSFMTGATPSLSLWYEKPSTTSATGNLYLTSSAGRLTLVSSSIFNDDFYSVSVVKENVTGSITLKVLRYDNGTVTSVGVTSSLSTSPGYPPDTIFTSVILGSTDVHESLPEFWGHEFRLWNSSLNADELESHAQHFESYGRDVSYNNENLVLHWRMNDSVTADGSGELAVGDSTLNLNHGSATGFEPLASPFVKSLEGYSYIPGIDYGWNQQKVRTYTGSTIDPQDAYQDERFISLEFNMYDALNEDISHLMSSYEELGNFLGLPMNRYREDYEGLQQMRETYFKRLQGKLNFRVFVDMLDFFDTTFVAIVKKLLPARSLFKGDELIVESHMLERPKYQYQLRPVTEGLIDICGVISATDWDEDDFR